jgi:hypothetical protein
VLSPSHPLYRHITTDAVQDKTNLVVEIGLVSKLCRRTRSANFALQLLNQKHIGLALRATSLHSNAVLLVSRLLSARLTRSVMSEQEIQRM